MDAVEKFAHEHWRPGMSQDKSTLHSLAAEYLSETLLNPLACQLPGDDQRQVRGMLHKALCAKLNITWEELDREYADIALGGNEETGNSVLHVRHVARELGVHPGEVVSIARQYGLRYVRLPGVYNVAGRNFYYAWDIRTLLDWLELNDRHIDDLNTDWPGIPIMRQRNGK